MRQYVGNACGTIAACHSIGNNAEELGVPATLAELGISRGDHGQIIADTLDLSAALEQHPTPFGSDQLKQALNRLQG